MKKILSIILAFTLCFCFVGCETPVEESQPALAAPQNVKITKIEDKDILTVTWGKVENAASYVVTVNDVDHTSVNEYYYIDLVGTVAEYSVTVYAKADGYVDSEKSAPVTYKRQAVNVGIRGGSEVRSGGTLQLESVVHGTANSDVTWEVVQGGDVISVNEDGLVTAKEVTGDKIVAVKATSVFDSTVSEIKALTVTAKPTLTQEMIDALNDDYLGFEGFMTVNLYTLMTNKFYDSVSYDISTSMNGNEWYAKYEVDVGLAYGMYVINDGGYASQVQVSLTNEDDPTPIEDDNGNPITWADGGLYNTFRGRNITLDAFTFNNETWRYEYRGMGLSPESREADKADFMSKIIAAANPYSFEPDTVSLILEDGAIAGLYATSKDDLTLQQNYVARMELTVAVNVGENTVKVGKIEKYKHEAMHDDLDAAIANMQALDNYTTEYLNICRNYLTSSNTYEGYIETVTPDVCNFRPYNFTPADENVTIGNGVRNFTGLDYGYVNRTDPVRGDFYNSYYADQDGTGAPIDMLQTARAYAADFKNAMPSFEFASEIFTIRVTDEETGKMYYYADAPMSAVASTFYRGLGTDMELYGMYATEGGTSAGSAFTPYVVVNDGYIESAGFYYYLGYLVGIVEINYYDFGTTETDENIANKLSTLAVRTIPNSWDKFVITDQLNDEVEVAADEYLKDFLNIEELPIESVVPVFNNALGDAFGFALATIRTTSDGSNKTIGFYYDVSIDLDYTLRISLNKIRDYLLDLGYTRNANNIYTKTYTDKNGQQKKIKIQPMDSQLDLFVYVWVVAA